MTIPVKALVLMGLRNAALRAEAYWHPPTGQILFESPSHEAALAEEVNTALALAQNNEAILKPHPHREWEDYSFAEIASIADEALSAAMLEAC